MTAPDSRAALTRLLVELLSIVGSMGDKLSDAQTLEALESYNRGDALMKADLDARELEADRALGALPIRRGRKITWRQTSGGGGTAC